MSTLPKNTGVAVGIAPLLQVAGGAIEALDLRGLLEDDDHLAPFATIPSKDNGIDLEGLAVDGETLFLGFPGPVLRGGSGWPSPLTEPEENRHAESTP